MSSQVRPARPSAFAHASGFPWSIRCGSTPERPNERKRARGSRPSRSTAASDATRTPAAPSQIWLEFPAVILPSGKNAGASSASASMDVSRRGVSSTPTSTPACGFSTSTGTTSRSKRPSSIAATARRCDSSEYVSSSSRESPHSSAITSAEIPCGTISQRSSSFSERSPPFDPIGTRDIISTPAETTRSSWPDQIAAAALKFVCIDDPHCRSTVVPQTVSGHPATSGTIRPRFQPCSPICVTQPSWTSSISAGSSEFRSTSPFSTWAASSSPRIDERTPFRLPIGLRTASTMKASGIENRVETPRSDTLELELAAVLEPDARARDEVFHGARHEHLTRPRRGDHPRGGVDGDAANLVRYQLALAGVQAGTDLEVERTKGIADCTRAANRPSRPVECREEAVAGRVHLAAAKALQPAPDERMVLLQERAPLTVAQLGGAFGGSHDVREEHGRQDAVGVVHGPGSGEELLHLVDDGVDVAGPDQVLVAEQLDVLRSRDLLRDPAALLDVHVAIVDALEHERRDLNRRQDLADVDLTVHPQERNGGARARAAA